VFKRSGGSRLEVPAGSHPRRASDRRAPLPPGFGTLWVTVALDLVGFGIVIPILALYAKRFGASPTRIGLLGSVFSLAQFVAAPLWGRLSDRIGRKPVIIASLVGTAVASLVCGLAGSLWLLFVARAVDGASGGSLATAQAAASDLAPPEERARLLGLLGAAFGVGFVLGPAIAGIAALVGRAVWPNDPLAPGRVAFFTAAFIAGANAVAAWVRLPETRRIVAPDSTGASRSSTDASPNGAGSGLAQSWRDGGLPVLFGVAFVSVAAFSAFETTFSLFNQNRLHFDEGAVAAVFVTVGVLVGVVQGGLLRPVMARFGEVSTLRMGLVFNAFGLLSLAFVHRWWLLGPPLVLLCAGQGLTAPSLTLAAVNRTDPQRRGAVLGAQQSVGSLARVGGPLLGGYLFQHAGVPVPYLVGAGLLAVCGVAIASAGIGPKTVVVG
jgi:MFS transporter, DHA1 family, tetracycline resistance protein